MKNENTPSVGSAQEQPPMQSVGSGTLLGALEAKLSPNAKHAMETHTIAFFRVGQEMTVGQLRAAIRSLYGAEVDDELERHYEARRQAVIPHSPNIPSHQRAD